MTLIERIRMIERTDGLVRRRATGSPNQLAERLGISVRSVYNLIDQMKEMGAPIQYCKNTSTYCYEYPVHFEIGFQNINQQSVIKKIVGGCSKLIPVQISCIYNHHLYSMK